MEKKTIDLLLIGGGHAHALFLRMWAMAPLVGVRVTLVSPQSQTAYSGMLPGVLSGVYREDEAHIDLIRLTAWAQVRFIRDSVVGVDANKKLVLLLETGELEFDYLSLNTGITPEMPKGFSSKVVGVKPTGEFLKVFHNVLNLNNVELSQVVSSGIPSKFRSEKYRPDLGTQHGSTLDAADSSSVKSMKIAVVGGGASGIEVALNLAIRLNSKAGVDKGLNKNIDLEAENKVCQSNTTENFSNVSKTVDEMNISGSSVDQSPIQLGSNVHKITQKSECEAIKSDGLGITGNRKFSNKFSNQVRCKIVLIHSGDVIGPSYSKGVRRLLEKQLEQLGIKVLLGLRIENEINGKLVAGDWEDTFDQIFWATQAGAPPWLKDSGLMTDSRGFLKVSRTLQSVSHPFVFGAGDVASVEGYHLAKSGVYAVRAAPVLFANLKKIMASQITGAPIKLKYWRPQLKFLSLIGLAGRTAIAGRGDLASQGKFFWWLKDKIDRRFMEKFVPPARVLKKMSKPEIRDSMVCKGCAAKVSPAIIASLLDRPLSKGVGEEDASVMLIEKHRILASIDRLTDIVADPYRFGQIAVNHAMSDLYASLSSGRYFLASIELSKQEQSFHLRDLRRLMAGIQKQANFLEVEMVSAHTSTGEGLAVSLAVMGLPQREKVKKVGGRLNDLIILTKPLGTGVVFAAVTQNSGNSRSYDEALESMLVSNREFADIFAEVGVEGVTDVTGFGLVGHLLELIPEHVTARLNFSQVPKFFGVDSLYQKGVKSSAHDANAQFSSFVDCRVENPEKSILYDPQTSGGLLACVSSFQFDSIKVQALEKKLALPWVVGSLVDRDKKRIIVAP